MNQSGSVGQCHCGFPPLLLRAFDQAGQALVVHKQIEEPHFSYKWGLIPLPPHTQKKNTDQTMLMPLQALGPNTFSNGR